MPEEIKIRITKKDGVENITVITHIAKYSSIEYGSSALFKSTSMSLNATQYILAIGCCNLFSNSTIVILFN